MADKISISRNELYSEQVDRQVQEQEAMARAQDHYAAAPISEPTPWWSTIIYHSVVYMTLGGLLGGCGAWVEGEIVHTIFATDLQEYQRVMALLASLQDESAAGEMSVAESDAQAEAIIARYRHNPYVAQLEASESQSDFERRIEDYQLRDNVSELVSGFLWFMVIGMTIALLLTIGEPLVSRNWFGCIKQGSIGLVMGMMGALVVAMFINQLYNFLLGSGGDPSIVRQVFARTVGWSVLGAFLALGPGVAIRHPVRCLIGLAGGLLGGAIGGFTFDVVAILSTDVLSRMVGIAAIGAFTGLGVGLLENAAKTGWVRVTGGLIAGKQFILYRNPTNIGSSPQCEIYLFKDPAVSPRHAAISKSPAGYLLEDTGSTTGILVNGSSVKRATLRSGDRIQIGSTELTFQERAAR